MFLFIIMFLSLFGTTSYGSEEGVGGENPKPGRQTVVPSEGHDMFYAQFVLPHGFTKREGFFRNGILSLFDNYDEKNLALRFLKGLSNLINPQNLENHYLIIYFFLLKESGSKKLLLQHIMERYMMPKL